MCNYDGDGVLDISSTVWVPSTCRVKSLTLESRIDGDFQVFRDTKNKQKSDSALTLPTIVQSVSPKLTDQNNSEHTLSNHSSGRDVITDRFPLTDAKRSVKPHPSPSILLDARYESHDGFVYQVVVFFSSEFPVYSNLGPF